MSDQFERFTAIIRHPLKFRLFLFSKLPSAWLAGLRVREIDSRKAVVSVPYKWLTKNPFRSTYFACLAMAAEMSTGALAMGFIYKRNPSVSMLVTGMEASYFRKAVSHTYFTCEDGELFEKMINEAILTGEPRQVRALSTGRNASGEIVAEMYLTWSFRLRQPKSA